MRRALLVCLLVAGCAETGAVEIAVPLAVAGTATEPFEGRDGWHISLHRADVAFGPLYLCSGHQAGELCATARAEWLGSVVVDALDPEPTTAGNLTGTSGMTRSWMYDHGITSLLTRAEPLALEAAEALGGSSVVIEGTATRDGERVDFVAEVPVRQTEATERGVPVVRKSTSDLFEHDLTGQEARLIVRFDPRPWLEGVDFDPLAGGDEGEVRVPSDGQGTRAIRNAVVAGERPAFEWHTTTKEQER